jgi:glycosyltransferase involved in cell wall biosynthesis
VGRPLLIGLNSPYWGSTLGGGEKYLGVTAEAIRDAFPGNRIEIGGPVPADRERYEAVLGLDLGGIELVSGNRRVTPMHRLANRLTPLRPLRNRVLASQAARSTARYDLYLAMAYRIPVHSRARRSVILCQFPYRSKSGVAEFQRVICQSEYVREWTRLYWEVDPLVVNPPIDRPGEDPEWSAKERRILSTGRFFAGGHSKRHDVLVEAFKRLCDDGLEGWTLDLAGSVHREGPHRGYYERIQALAAGYPVELHPDAPLPALHDLYRKASIYWHAAGLGAAEGDPEQREHFGMTVAEAMGYGAVPVVYAAGGVGEIVRDGADGLHWQTFDELLSLTSGLVATEQRRQALGAAARASSARFTRDVFKRKMAAALAPLVEELGG